MTEKSVPVALTSAQVDWLIDLVRDAFEYADTDFGAPVYEYGDPVLDSLLATKGVKRYVVDAHCTTTIRVEAADETSARRAAAHELAGRRGGGGWEIDSVKPQ